MSIRSLKPENAALVVCDYQEKLLKIMDEDITRRMVANINLMVQMWRHWDAPILVTEQYPKGLGHTYQPIREHLEAIPVMEKLAFSCCGAAGFMEALEDSQCANVVVVGMETHICVLQTVLDLLERDYGVYVVVDAVQSSSKLKWETGLRVMEQQGATLVPAESVLYQMLERAKGPDFKFLVNLIKNS